MSALKDYQEFLPAEQLVRSQFCRQLWKNCVRSPLDADVGSAAPKISSIHIAHIWVFKSPIIFYTFNGFKSTTNSIWPFCKQITPLLIIHWLGLSSNVVYCYSHCNSMDFTCNICQWCIQMLFSTSFFPWINYCFVNIIFCIDLFTKCSNPFGNLATLSSCQRQNYLSQCLHTSRCWRYLIKWKYINLFYWWTAKKMVQNVVFTINNI